MNFTEWRLRLPYGKWTCPDGREVLFNRDYKPILERMPGQPAKPADPTEWVDNIQQGDSTKWIEAIEREIADLQIRKAQLGKLGANNPTSIEGFHNDK
jgi:hypothetical protein